LAPPPPPSLHVHMLSVLLPRLLDTAEELHDRLLPSLPAGVCTTVEGALSRRAACSTPHAAPCGAAAGGRRDSTTWWCSSSGGSCVLLLRVRLCTLLT
jgi:hypothetical protein